MCKPSVCSTYVARGGSSADCACSCGPGSTDGCLSKQIPFDTDGSAAAIKSSPPKRAADKLKNMNTTFPKAGGCGQPWKDRTLGEVPKYHPDTYEGYREKEKVSKPFLHVTDAGTAACFGPGCHAQPWQGHNSNSYAAL
eukprot:GHRR01036242.1.p1 GENE.GHRR01036242.1~~GHRR01036242.1.p1  ORF type:complete len:139 (-),score=35.04 GHRR01036242.1:228-644(-)